MPVQEIGNILLSSKVVSKAQLEFALDIQKNTSPGQRLGRILKYYNFASDEDIAKALAKQVGWEYFDKKYILDIQKIEKIGLDFLIDRAFIPVESENELVFIFAYPFDTEATDLLVSLGLGDKERYIGSESVILSHLELFKNKKIKQEIDKKINLLKERGIVGDELKGLLDELLNDAIIHNATDIHIEPGEKISTIRFRIDGILYFKFCIPLEVHNNLINVVFSRAEITVSDFYRFHDARFQHNYSEHSVDIRVSCIPSVFGPALVLRLLDVNKTLITLPNLGFDALHFENISRIVRKPHGIIIITGPTGSGKTTTLYAVLNQLKDLSTKVLTIEDPVEIKMPLINQVQINEKQGISFAHATRAFLRHDPNIILIGEIRDPDTAQEAIRASITGHRVLSTLHTNTAVDSIYRLHDFGIDLSYIANGVLCVISQRLIRKLCPFCRKRVKVKKENMPESFKQLLLGENENEIRLFKAGSCEHCQSGYKGRTVIAEILDFDEEIQDMVASGKLDQLRNKWREKAYLTLEQDAGTLLLKGLTSLEEAERILG
jgi:type II secretory ATPase GspE/PulE/Tfp pilus assembly ATPase PilB-like protein